MNKRPLSIRALIALLAVLMLAMLGAPTPADAAEGTHELSTTTDGLSTPQGVGVSRDGVVYVADTGANVIRKIDAAGNESVYAGSAVSGATITLALAGPSGVVVDFYGVVYIADTGNHRVWKIGADNVPLAFAGTGAAGNGADSGAPTAVALNSPIDVAIAQSGAIYISDTGNNKVRAVTGNGTIITTVAGDGTAAFGGDGAAATAAQLNSPMGIDIDKTGVLYIADTNNNRIREVSTGGIITTHTGNGDTAYDVAHNETAATTSAINAPEGVAVDKALNVYVADTGNNRIRKVTAGGVLVDLAGDAVTAAGTAGVATDATLGTPAGIAADRHGSLYITGRTDGRLLEVHQPDTILPAVTISSPAATPATPGATQTSQGKTLKFNFTCTDDYSGIDTCVGTLNGSPVASGTTIPTGSLTTHTLKVTGTDGEGNITVVNLSVKIVDRRIATGTYAGGSGTNGAVSRLYLGIMDRQPEDEGHVFWMGEVDAGRLALSDIAAFFITSPEFQLLYGDATQEEFVLLLYTNIMQRPGDTEGIAFWNSVLAAGTMSRLDVTLFFTQGDEFKIYSKTS